ncbi:hypothetical protein ACEWY4_010457 [Coilia grayii]|uniref:HAT C-terminal dimerisation domain-containing protein n=1 Tax=Coilia grayii TaxID=363190 RepID=A0ABD1K1Y7_9TELE
MLESIHKQYQDIRELLQSRDQAHRFDGIHQDQLTQLIEFLTLFKLAISELEGECYPTIHMVLLWFCKLKKHCEPKFGDVPYMRSLRSRPSALLDEKMRPTATHKIATFLHPKYKALKMLMEEEREEVLKQVRELLLAEGGTRVSGEKKSKTDFTEWEDDDTGPVDEVQDYSSTNFNLGSVDENLLSFWKAQGQTFPRLQHLAKRILSIPATSAASERSFSAAGRVIEARRSRLNPDTVHAVLFLHSAKKKK